MIPVNSKYDDHSLAHSSRTVGKRKVVSNDSNRASLEVVAVDLVA